jgi:hypothetical protein
VASATATTAVQSKLDRSPSKAGMLVFGIILLAGILYAAINLMSDLSGVRSASVFAYLLLAIALLTASDSNSSTDFMTRPTPWLPSSTRIRSSRTWLSCGPASGTFLVS